MENAQTRLDRISVSGSATAADVERRVSRSCSDARSCAFDQPLVDALGVTVEAHLLASPVHHATESLSESVYVSQHEFDGLGALRIAILLRRIACQGHFLRAIQNTQSGECPCRYPGKLSCICSLHC